MVLRQDPDIEMDPNDRLNPSRHAMPQTPKKKGVKVRHSRATMVYCYAGLLFVVGILIPISLYLATEDWRMPVMLVMSMTCASASTQGLMEKVYRRRKERETKPRF